MIVEKFGSKDIKEIEDPPQDHKGCIYCYAASKTCLFCLQLIRIHDHGIRH